MTTTKTTAYTFAPDSMICKGKTFPVEYAIQPSGTVTAFVQLDGRRVRVRFDEGAAEYPAARAAAEAARAAWTAARTADPATADKQEDKPAAKKSAAAKKERPEIIPADKPAAPAQEERPETIPADKPAERPETIPTPEVLPVAPAADPPPGASPPGKLPAPPRRKRLSPERKSLGTAGKSFLTPTSNARESFSTTPQPTPRKRCLTPPDSFTAGGCRVGTRN